MTNLPAVTGAVAMINLLATRAEATVDPTITRRLDRVEAMVEEGATMTSLRATRAEAKVEADSREADSRVVLRGRLSRLVKAF